MIEPKETPTRAELLLNQLPTGQRLINRLKKCMETDVAPRKATLSNTNKSKIQAFHNELQKCVDQLSAQREEVVSLIKLIPDEEQQLVLKFRYGLFGDATEKSPWDEVKDNMGYWDIRTIYRRHNEALNNLNEILERKDGETYAET